MHEAIHLVLRSTFQPAKSIYNFNPFYSLLFLTDPLSSKKIIGMP